MFDDHVACTQRAMPEANLRKALGGRASIASTSAFLLLSSLGIECSAPREGAVASTEQSRIDSAAGGVRVESSRSNSGQLQSAEDRATTRTGKGLPASRVYFIDCNSNGIDDVEDLKSGVAQDSNKDGAIDDCNLAIEEEWARRHQALGPEAPSEQSRHFRVVYLENQGLRILYAVSGRDRLVRIVVARAAADSVILRNEKQKPGIYDLLYEPRENGQLLTRSSAVVRMTIGSRRYVQPVEWDWSSERH
jgi:hypothetical protein